MNLLVATDVAARGLGKHWTPGYPAMDMHYISIIWNGKDGFWAFMDLEMAYDTINRQGMWHADLAIHWEYMEFRKIVAKALQFSRKW